MKHMFSSNIIFRAGSVLFLCSMITNLFNYLFQITMGRMLTVAEYGLMNALLSIAMVVSIPLSAFFLLISRQVSEAHAQDQPSNLRLIYIAANKKTLLPVLFCICFYTLFSGSVQRFLHSPSVFPLVFLGVAVLCYMPVLIHSAFLQGVQNFKWLSIVQALFGPLKYIFCLLLVFAGFGVTGVMAGVAIGYLGQITATCFPLKKILKKRSSHSVCNTSFSFSGIHHILIANISFAVLSQADMPLVRHLFPADMAGMYASASILGKAVMYLPAAFVLAMYPVVAGDHARNRSSSGVLFKTMLITFLLSGSGALLLFLFPETILGVLFGNEYRQAHEILRFFGFAMLPMALVMLLLNYFIAKGKSSFSYILMVFAVLEVAAIYFFSEKIIWIVYIILLSSAGCLTAGLGIVLSDHRKKDKRD